MDTNQAKALLGIESDYRLAKTLGVTKQAVSKWNHKYAGEVPKDREDQVRRLAKESALADTLPEQ